MISVIKFACFLEDQWSYKIFPPSSDPTGTESEGRAVRYPGDFHVKGPWQILAKEMGIIKTESIRKLSNF